MLVQRVIISTRGRCPHTRAIIQTSSATRLQTAVQTRHRWNPANSMTLYYILNDGSSRRGQSSPYLIVELVRHNTFAVDVLGTESSGTYIYIQWSKSYAETTIYSSHQAIRDMPLKTSNRCTLKIEIPQYHAQAAWTHTKQHEINDRSRICL